MLSRRLLLGSVLLLILLGAVITVRKPWTKSEGERSEGALPGILPRPAPLASRRWQLETVSPRSMMHSIAWSPGGERLASASRDKTVRLWSAHGEPGPVTEHQERVWSIAWSPDGARLASGGGTVMLWDIDTVEPQWVGVLFSNKRSVTFSAAGKVLYGHSDLIEQQLVYVVEDSGGRLDLLKPSEFYERQPPASQHNVHHHTAGG